MPCSIQPLERFATFLRSVLNGEPLGAEVFHAFPQALKISAATRFDRIIQLESPTVEAEALHRETGIDLLGSLNANLAAGRDWSSDDQWAGCAAPIDLEAAPTSFVSLFCRLYEADYACGLGYALPRACAALLSSQH